MTRRLAMACLLLVAACDGPMPGRVRYNVVAHDTQIRSAVVTLCESETELEARDGVWTADVPAACEGGGQIMVVLADGAAVSCSGDYVEPGSTQTFGYVASSTGCAFSE